MAVELVPVATKVPKEIYEELQREAAERGMSSYEYLRFKLSQKSEENFVANGPVSDKIDHLESQVSELTSAVKALVDSRQNERQFAEMVQAFGKLTQEQNEQTNAMVKRIEAQIIGLGTRIEKGELSNADLSQNIGNLIEFLTQQQQAPFGLRLGFIQGTMQALNVVSQCIKEDKPTQFNKHAALVVDKSRPDWKPQN